MLNAFAESGVYLPSENVSTYYSSEQSHNPPAIEAGLSTTTETNHNFEALLRDAGNIPGVDFEAPVFPEDQVSEFVETFDDHVKCNTSNTTIAPPSSSYAELTSNPPKVHVYMPRAYGNPGCAPVTPSYISPYKTVLDKNDNLASNGGLGIHLDFSHAGQFTTPTSKPTTSGAFRSGEPALPTSRVQSAAGTVPTAHGSGRLGPVSTFSCKRKTTATNQTCLRHLLSHTLRHRSIPQMHHRNPCPSRSRLSQLKARCKMGAML